MMLHSYYLSQALKFPMICLLTITFFFFAQSWFHPNQTSPLGWLWFIFLFEFFWIVFLASFLECDFFLIFFVLMIQCFYDDSSLLDDLISPPGASDPIKTKTKKRKRKRERKTWRNKKKKKREEALDKFLWFLFHECWLIGFFLYSPCWMMMMGLLHGAWPVYLHALLVPLRVCIPHHLFQFLTCCTKTSCHGS